VAKSCDHPDYPKHDKAQRPVSFRSQQARREGNGYRMFSVDLTDNKIAMPRTVKGFTQGALFEGFF